MSVFCDSPTTLRVTPRVHSNFPPCSYSNKTNSKDMCSKLPLHATSIKYCLSRAAAHHFWISSHQKRKGRDESRRDTKTSQGKERHQQKQRHEKKRAVHPPIRFLFFGSYIENKTEGCRGRIAQLVERGANNAAVLGSSPSMTITFWCIFCFLSCLSSCKSCDWIIWINCLVILLPCQFFVCLSLSFFSTAVAKTSANMEKEVMVAAQVHVSFYVV